MMHGRKNIKILSVYLLSERLILLVAYFKLKLCQSLHWLNPSGPTMALASNQPLAEM